MTCVIRRTPSILPFSLFLKKTASSLLKGDGKGSPNDRPFHVRKGGPLASCIKGLFRHVTLNIKTQQSMKICYNGRSMEKLYKVVVHQEANNKRAETQGIEQEKGLKALSERSPLHG